MIYGYCLNNGKIQQVSCTGQKLLDKCKKLYDEEWRKPRDEKQRVRGFEGDETGFYTMIFDSEMGGVITSSYPPHVDNRDERRNK